MFAGQPYTQRVVFRLLLIASLALAATYSRDAVAWRGGGGWHGGGGGGWHGGWGGWHGGWGGWHGGWRGGVFLGFGFGGYGYPYGGGYYGYPAYSYPAYGYAPYSAYPSYGGGYPNAYTTNLAPPDVAASAQSPNVWYYCPSKKAYYPYVATCAIAWQQVPTEPASVRAAKNAKNAVPVARANAAD